MSSTKPNPRRANSAARNKIRKRLISQANGHPTCALCGQPIDLTLKTPHPLSCEIDEIIPVSKGGNPFDLTNCQLTHRRCNQRKSNHLYTKLTPQQTKNTEQHTKPIPLSRTW